MTKESGTVPPRPRIAVRNILAILAVLILPAAFALSTVDAPRPMIPVDAEHSQLGYTWSLLFFVIPVAVLLVWFHRHPRLSENRRPLWIAWAFLFGLGVLLDSVFGSMFFTFENVGATLGIKVPVVGGTVPVEEFGFYSFGFGAILLAYIWCNEYWLREYNHHERGAGRAPAWSDLIRVHWSTVIASAIVVAGAIAWRLPDGFPGYFIFLLVTGVAPNILFFHAVGRYINWRALCFTSMLMLPISLLWEGVLGVPYQWWGYKGEQMLGIRIRALSDLPIEEPLLWIVVSYAGVTIYEVFRLKLGADREAVSVRAR